MSDDLLRAVGIAVLTEFTGEPDEIDIQVVDDIVKRIKYDHAKRNREPAPAEAGPDWRTIALDFARLSLTTLRPLENCRLYARKVARKVDADAAQTLRAWAGPGNIIREAPAEAGQPAQGEVPDYASEFEETLRN